MKTKNLSNMSILSKQKIERIIEKTFRKTIKKYIRKNSSQSKIQKKQNLSNKNVFNDNTFRFQSKKLNFFNFFYQNKSTSKIFSFENTNENIIYRNVYIFINRIKQFIETYEKKIIRNNFYRCLQNHVLIWHITLLSNVELKLLIFDKNLKKWKKF